MAPRACERDGEIRGGGRFALSFERARDHDRPRVATEGRELEVRAQDPERLGGDAVGGLEHGELLVAPETSPGVRKTREQREVEDCPDLLRRAEARVGGFAEQREPEPQHEAEREPDQAVAYRARPDLPRPLCLAYDDRVRLLKRNERRQLVGLVLQLPSIVE